MVDPVSLVQRLVDFILHVDKHLDVVLAQMGGWTYGVLFLILFCETGLVITPFLPGDSLLFATGALIARSDILSIHGMALILFIAAVAGDFVNYHIGKVIGPKAFEFNSRFLKREYLIKTQKFFEKHGNKSIVMARFVPIVRTFAPFLAGVGSMGYRQFLVYNVVGGFFWVVIFLYAGYAFGDIPQIRKNFTLMIFGIIIVSLLPMIVEVWRARCQSRKDQ